MTARSGLSVVLILLISPAHRAKLLLAFQGWLVGFDGQFEFENIGDSYIENKVPYVGMRTLPALLGSAIPAVVYAIMRESGYPRIVGLFSASLVLFGEFCVSGLTRSPMQLNLCSLQQTMLTSGRLA